MLIFEIAVLGYDMEELEWLYISAPNSEAELECAFEKAHKLYGNNFYKVMITEEYIDGKRKH